MGNVSERTNSRLALSNNLAHAYAELSPPIRFAEFLCIFYMYTFFSRRYIHVVLLGAHFTANREYLRGHRQRLNIAYRKLVCAVLILS